MSLFFSRKSMNPCKNCTDRAVGCHSGCKKYEEWSNKEKAIKDKITAEKTKEFEIDSYFEKATRKSKARRR